ncbi:MAG: isocitrate lyase/phosphoenolpyruvate mutase family protein [Pseudomonadota bacterium]
MNDRKNKSDTFHALHRKGDPLVLYNVWDAGSASAAAKAGAEAIATGSWSVAAAQGYADGEAIPLKLLAAIAKRICETVDLPVTIDFEGGFAESPEDLGRTTGVILDTGAVGVNFEDQRVGGEGLYVADEQARRIEAVRKAADQAGVTLFINARTDVFLKARKEEHDELLEEAIDRAAAYAEAGASGFFAPGLIDEALIGALCERVDLPVNVMMKKGLPEKAALSALGVARISHGPGPFVAAMAAIEEAAAAALV